MLASSGLNTIASAIAPFTKEPLSPLSLVNLPAPKKPIVNCTVPSTKPPTIVSVSGIISMLELCSKSGPSISERFFRLNNGPPSVLTCNTVGISNFFSNQEPIEAPASPKNLAVSLKEFSTAFAGAITKASDFHPRPSSSSTSGCTSGCTWGSIDSVTTGGAKTVSALPLPKTRSKPPALDGSFFNISIADCGMIGSSSMLFPFSLLD